MLEIETRSLIHNQAEVIEILKANGFVHQKDIVQQDIMFDLKNGSLFKSGQKIRIRLEDDKAELTYKGFMKENETLSIREELNIPIFRDQIDAYRVFFQELGYSMLFQVKKNRSIWNTDYVQVTIDEWPIIGKMMEIEGEEDYVYDVIQLFPEYQFKNYRLKEFFEMKMKETNKTLTELKEEYFEETNFDLGQIEMIL